MRNRILAMAAAAALACGAADAQQTAARENFMLSQAYEQVQRVAAQLDVLETNINALSARIDKLERGGGDIGAVKAEIEALKAENARLRREMQQQRREIVADIVAKIKQATPPARQAAAPRAAETAPAGDYEEYTVQKGDTLSLIAQAFGTTYGKLKQINGLKSDNLRIGQKLMVPAQQKGGRK